MSGDEAAVQQDDSAARDDLPSPAFLGFDGPDDLAATALLEAAATLGRLSAGEVFLTGLDRHEDVHLLVEGELEVHADGIVIERLEPGQCTIGRPPVGTDVAARRRIPGNRSYSRRDVKPEIGMSEFL